MPPDCELRPVRHWRERQSLREQDHSESDHQRVEMVRELARGVPLWSDARGWNARDDIAEAKRSEVSK